jgi:hypothetical protein
MHCVLAATLVNPQSCAVLPSNLTVPRLVKEFTSLTKPEGPLRYSQIPATYPYPEVDEFTSRSHIMFLEDTF